MSELLIPNLPRAKKTRTYGKILFEPSANRWRLIDVEPHVVIRLKDVFKRIPKTADAKEGLTLANGPDIAADLDWFLSRYPMDMEPAVRERITTGKQRFEVSRDRIEEILLPDWKPPLFTGFKQGVQPYPFQAQAAEMTTQLRRLLLLDDVGLGKTFSAMAVMVSDPSVLPAAVIVPSHLADQWVLDYIEPYTHLRAHIIKGTRPYTLPEADVYIFKYSNIAGWADIASRGTFRSVFWDEVQDLRRGEETAKGKASIAFRDAADVRWGGTATPVYNYGDEMYKVVEFIAPGSLGEWYEFVREWCSSVGVGKYKVTDPKALGTYLREQQIVLRRTEEEVGGQMPPVNVVAHEVGFDEDLSLAAAERARLLALKVMKGSFVERGKAARELDALARHDTGVAKAKDVVDYVRVILEADVPVLLCGWHRDVYDIWMRELADHKPVLYTGSETTTQKRRSKDAFINGETNLMIISLRSGAGLDGLQRVCSTIVFGELDWSPQVHKQCIGRLRRPGQTEQVDAIYLWCSHGSDPLMIETNGLKASQARGIVDPHLGVEEVFSDESRVKRLAETYIKNKWGAAA